MGTVLHNMLPIQEMMRRLATILIFFAMTAFSSDETNTVVTAKVTAHRMSAAGCMDGVGGVYFYRTHLIVITPTNFAGIALSSENVVSSPLLAQSNAVVRVRLPTDSLTRARDQKQPCNFLLSQMIIDTEVMLQADSRLVAQFKKIAVGMSPTEVRAIMGVEPQTGSGKVWVFKLSPASDRTSEIDWKLLVRFDEDKVVATQTTYTCLYTTEKE